MVVSVVVDVKDVAEDRSTECSGECEIKFGWLSFMVILCKQVRNQITEFKLTYRFHIVKDSKPA